MTTRNEMSDPITHHVAPDPAIVAEFKDIDHTVLRKIVNGNHWTQITGKHRDRKFLVPLVNSMQTGTLSDLLQHPTFLEVLQNLQELKLQDLTQFRSQGVDVLAAFVQPYTAEDDIRLAGRVRNWATHVARELVLNETHPFASSLEQLLVEKTQSDPLFWKHYNFKSWTEGWKLPIRGDPSSPVKLVSIDCESVICETEGREFYSVVRLCAVGSDYQTVIDELFVPSGRVVNYCTTIHGITEEDLRGATLTREDAQARVMELLTPGTVLVGHSLHSDLKTLEIDYKRVIDAAFLFLGCRKTKNQICGLTDVCEAVFKYKFREEGSTHDCLQDVILPMKLVHHALDSLSLSRLDTNGWFS